MSAGATDKADDKYKIFDSSEFQAGASIGRVIGFEGGGVVLLQRRYSYTAALGMLAAGLGCLLAVVFLLMFSVCSVRTGQLQAQVQSLRQADSQTCRSELCLQHATYQVRIMNRSVDPCQDFYEYACGNYDRVLAYDYWFAYTTVFHEMDKKAQADIETALSKPITLGARWEQKVKRYYWTCLQYYRSHQHMDNPLVTEVLNRTDTGGLGGYLFGRSVADANVDLMFRTVSGKYFVPSLFTAYSGWNDYLHKSNSDRRYTIWVGRSKQSVGIIRYNLYYSKHKDIYKQFVKEVAQLLVRDSKMAIPNQDQIVETFASDVLDMEQRLFEIHSRAWISEWQMYLADNPSHPDRMLKVSDLTSRMSSLIDFKAYLREIYGRGRIMDDTRVVMYSTHYMDSLNTLLTQMQANDSLVFKRKVGNYLTWALASFFEWDLSPEYRLKFKAIRQITWYTYSPEETAHGFCFDTTRWGMKKALSALYVREYFSSKSRDKGNQLFEQLRQAAKDSIDRVDWIDAETRRLAKQRVDGIVEKSGYPDEAMDDGYLDREFEQVDPTNGYFRMLISSIEYRKWRHAKLLGSYNPLDMQHWGQLWDTHYSYHLYDNEILVQAGILQTPLFSKDLPQQLVYGGLGTLLAHEVVNSFDVVGQLYDQSVGYRKQGWWSQSTLEKYRDRVACVRDAMKDFVQYYEQGRLGDLSEEEREAKIEELLKSTINWTAAEVGGLKHARRAFDIHKNDNPMHVRLPVQDTSEEQMFYIGYAQMNCHHKGVYHEWKSWKKNWYPWKILVNIAVAQVPEFAQTFGCKPGSQLNPEKRCNLY